MKKDFPFSVPAFLTFAHCIRDPSRPQTLTSSVSCAWASPMRRQHSTGRAACTARSSQCGCLGPQGSRPLWFLSATSLCHQWATGGAKAAYGWPGRKARFTPLSPMCFAEESLRPAPGASEIISFSADNDYLDEAMSLTASEKDWAHIPEDSSKVEGHATFQDELVRILTKAMSDLCRATGKCYIVFNNLCLHASCKEEFIRIHSNFWMEERWFVGPDCVVTTYTSRG